MLRSGERAQIMAWLEREVNQAQSVTAAQTEGADQPRPEVVEGLIREGQIVAVAGTYGLGKSPWLQELFVCRIHGIPWCGRTVGQGTAVLFDFENPESTIRRNMSNICKRHRVAFPRIPEELELYSELGNATSNAATAKLPNALKCAKLEGRFDLLEEALQNKPNALAVIDPPEMFFLLNTRDKIHVLQLYTEYRLLLSEYCRAAILNTFNLRKRDKRVKTSDLLTNPRDWLEEISGSLDLLNRSDVRLGMSFHRDETLVVNGVRRGEEMHPVVIRPFFLDDEPDKPAGFALVPPGEVDLISALSGKLLEYWRKLPNEFTFEQAVQIMGKSNFDRLKKRTTSLGLLEQTHRGWYRKLTR